MYLLQELLPAFCNAYEDPAILGDARVLANMLWVEAHYVPAPPSLCYGRTQDEIKPHMRRIVVEWMLDVCVDQRCNVDVFLLATNIIGRFLSTIRLVRINNLLEIRRNHPITCIIT